MPTQRSSDGIGNGMLASCQCFARRVKWDSKNQQKILPTAKPLKKLAPSTVHGVVFGIFV
jgi:hypothetical protein